ncbi:MAG TPA: hypothetical protein VG944_13095 [Fimbriimonas sp.]|nr:hypothetical protein [Fimbriimonas sp.]
MLHPFRQRGIPPFIGGGFAEIGPAQQRERVKCGELGDHFLTESERLQHSPALAELARRIAADYHDRAAGCGRIDRSRAAVNR